MPDENKILIGTYDGENEIRATVYHETIHKLLWHYYGLSHRNLTRMSDEWHTQDLTEIALSENSKDKFLKWQLERFVKINQDTDTRFFLRQLYYVVPPMVSIAGFSFNPVAGLVTMMASYLPVWLANAVYASHKERIAKAEFMQRPLPSVFAI